MLKPFKKYIAEQQLFVPTDKILLAVSGGMDSMAMTHLFHQAGFYFGIAHCNFQLRGTESDADEQLVKAFAESLKVPYHTRRFETQLVSDQLHQSIEMVARTQRYKWFAELLESTDYQYVATAHHLNDSLETVLFNLVKGTGIRGLHGIPVKKANVIRPLSFATREGIASYVTSENISYREDASNSSLDHHRNLIRHRVIPPLRKINPSLENTFSKTLQQLKETEELFNWAVRLIIEKLLILDDSGGWKININNLKTTVSKRTVLYEIIRSYGFNSDHVDQIFRAIDHVGARFYSKTHQILVERKTLVLKKKSNRSAIWVTLEMLPDSVELPIGKLAATVISEKPATLNQGRWTALVDLDKITLPLTIRQWREGDRFLPLGMGGKSKKIKDLLRDYKVSVADKEKSLVVESADQIVWVIGHRADERFKITDTTHSVLKLEIQKSFD